VTHVRFVSEPKPLDGHWCRAIPFAVGVPLFVGSDVCSLVLRSKWPCFVSFATSRDRNLTKRLTEQLNLNFSPLKRTIYFSAEHCIGTTSRKPSIVWPKPYPRNSRTSFYYPMHSEPATPLSTPRSLEVPVGRSISAPSGHSEKARASCFSRMKYSASKIPSAPSEIAPKSRPQRASSTRMMSAPNRLRPRNSGTPKNVTRIFSGRNTCVAVKEAPLDIVGTGVSPCRPKSAVRVRRSPSFCKYPDVQSSNDPAPPREVCIIPTNNTKETCLFPTEKLKSKPSTAISNVGEKCTCNSRSVRFSCSGNTVHEYESTEPISGDEEVFSKESPAVFGITKLSEWDESDRQCTLGKVGSFCYFSTNLSIFFSFFNGIGWNWNLHGHTDCSNPLSSRASAKTMSGCQQTFQVKRHIFLNTQGRWKTLCLAQRFELYACGQQSLSDLT